MYDYIFVAFIVLSVLVSIYVTQLLTLVLFASFVFFMYIGIRALGNKIGGIITDTALNETKMLQKIGVKLLSLSPKFKYEFRGINGAIRLFKKIFLLNFITVLLITRYLGPAVSPESVGASWTGFLLAIIISVFASIIISPFSVGLYVIENSSIRLFNTKDGLIEKPGKYVRLVFKAIFGYGNLIVLVYLLLDSIHIANNNLGAGIGIFVALVLLVYGAIALSALVSSVLLSVQKGNIINDLLDKFVDTCKKDAIPLDEASNLFKQLFEEPVHEEPVPEPAAEDVLQETG